MGKRIIFTEDGSKVGAEIETFVTVDGNIAFNIRYSDDCDAEVRCIELSRNDFDEMITLASEELNRYFEDGK